MNILVLGSHGFIGSHIVAYSLSKGHTVTGCDLVEDLAFAFEYHKMSILSSDFDTMFSRKKFDICINASGSGNVSYSMAHPISDFEANAYTVVKVLDTIKKYQPACKYLHISSAAVYGNPKGLPITELDTPAPLSPYGYHKYMSEQLCREYHHLFQLPVAIIRPFSVYGNGLKKQLLWDTCTKFSKRNEVVLYGTGNETRDFIHISDLVELMFSIIETDSFQCEIYNAAIGEETSIRQIADIFEKNFPGKKQVSFSGEVKLGDPINWRADISRITALGFKPKAVLEEAVKDYINWYCNLPHA